MHTSLQPLSSVVMLPEEEALHSTPLLLTEAVYSPAKQVLARDPQQHASDTRTTFRPCALIKKSVSLSLSEEQSSVCVQQWRASCTRNTCGVLTLSQLDSVVLPVEARILSQQ